MTYPTQMKTITVFCNNGNPLLVNSLAAEEMHLVHGQYISESQMWEAICLNSQTLVTDIETRKLMGEPNLPDTTKLQHQINRLHR